MFSTHAMVVSYENNLSKLTKIKMKDILPVSDTNVNKNRSDHHQLTHTHIYGIVLDFYSTWQNKNSANE